MASSPTAGPSNQLMLSSMSGRSLENGPPTVLCESEGCARLFHTEYEMREHLAKDDHRSYCFKCKMDFSSPANLFIHKVTSKKHFTCPLCKLDFHSAGGRDRHIQSNHLPDQNIACSGCGKPFKTASSLIKHIECNECPAIGTSRLLLEQHRREQVANTLQERAMFGPMTGYFEQPAPMPNLELKAEESDYEDASEPNEIEEGQGGVSIEPKEGLTESALNKALALIEANDQKHAPDDDSNATLKAITQWPAVNKYIPNNAKHDTVDDIFLRTLRFDENGAMFNEGASPPTSPDELIGWEEIDEEPSKGDEAAPNGNFGLQLMPPTETIRQRIPGWHPRMHFDEERNRFVCHACDYVTVDERDFEYHVAMEQRWITTTQCLQCGRIFSSTAALVAHMEQVRSRCGVRDSVEFARLLGDVTGGLIQVRGELEDGTERIVARKLEAVPFQVTQRDDTAIEADLVRFKKSQGRD